MLTRRRAIAGVGAATMASAGAASAQTWPSRQISLVLPFVAGSGTDTMARLIGERLSAKFGQPVLVDNKAGANGSIAATTVARAAPDGHTLMVTTNTTHAANPSLLKNLPYDPVKDFEPVALVGLAPFVLVTHPSVPVATFAELVARAKANPGKMSFAAGTSTAHICGESMKRLAGIDILRVPYKSAPPALNDVISGQVEMTFIDIGTGLPHIRAGKVKTLVATDAARSPHLPDVPTLRALGMEFDIVAWYAVYAPLKTPAEIVGRLNAAINEMMASADMKERMDRFSVVIKTGTPDDLGKWTRSEIEKWGRLARAAGIEPEG
ncbi:MAG: tripartite tricarboxylate transporter substrate binding protein [Rhodospirillales bacterium]|nr:MAG: tripartite tricarboxylate transporter substrate binding protein [Rhodospirillales bacterium]